MSEQKKLNVAVLGFGAIGKQVVEGIGQIEGVNLTGVVVRRPGSAVSSSNAASLSAASSNTASSNTASSSVQDLRELSLEEAIEQSDLIVESAGGEALKALGPKIVGAGKDLLAVSFGQLVDEQLRKTLLVDGPGRTYLSTGAIGGLDILSAAKQGGGLSEARLISNKLPKALVQKWMSEEEAERLINTQEAVTVFEGDVFEAIKLFPASLNIAVALAAATGLWQETRVQLVADPQAKLTKHRVSASGATGNYSFEIVNEPSPENPATSGVVAKALLRGISALSAPSGTFI